MQMLLDTTIAYTKVRVQFGRPIADNQVLRHRMADMAIRARRSARQRAEGDADGRRRSAGARPRRRVRQGRRSDAPAATSPSRRCSCTAAWASPRSSMSAPISSGCWRSKSCSAHRASHRPPREAFAACSLRQRHHGPFPLQGRSGVPGRSARLHRQQPLRGIAADAALSPTGIPEPAVSRSWQRRCCERGWVRAVLAEGAWRRRLDAGAALYLRDRMRPRRRADIVAHGRADGRPGHHAASARRRRRISTCRASSRAKTIGARAIPSRIRAPTSPR